MLLKEMATIKRAPICGKTDEPKTLNRIVINDLENGVVTHATNKTVENERTTKVLTTNGDVVLGYSKDEFKVARIKGPKATIAMNILLLHFEDELHSISTQVYLNSEAGREAIKAITNGEIIKRVNRKNLAELEIPLLTKDEISEYKELEDEYNNSQLRLFKAKQALKSYKYK